MASYSDLMWLRRQLDETHRLLEENKDSLIMRLSLTDRISMLEKEIENFGEINNYDTTVRLWFAGDAVYGSKGIYTDFAGLTSNMVSNMIQAKYVEMVSNVDNISSKGKLKGVSKTKMYISNVLHGSFGYEMGWVNDELFSEEFASQAIQEVIGLIDITANDESAFNENIVKQPIRVVSYLRKFFKELSSRSSILKIESGSNYKEILKENLILGYDRIKEAVKKEEIIRVKGVFKGVLLESGKFEFIDEQEQQKRGTVSEELPEERVIELTHEFINKQCTLVINQISISNANGYDKVDFVLMNVEP